MGLELRPISFRPATEFVKQHHRHHGATSGCKWCLAAYEGDKLVGVAICCRPVARKLDDGTVCELQDFAQMVRKRLFVPLWSLCESSKRNGLQEDYHLYS